MYIMLIRIYYFVIYDYFYSWLHSHIYDKVQKPSNTRESKKCKYSIIAN